MKTKDGLNPSVCQFPGCCIADSQTDDDRNQLYNNLKIAKLKDLA